MHAVALGADFDRYFRWRRHRDGDPFLVSFPGFGSILFTGHSDGAQDVFRTPGALLEPPQPNPIAPLVGEASIILAAGERHRQERTLLMPPLHGARMQSYGVAIAEATAGEIRTWRAGRRIDAQAHARAIALQVILGVVLGSSSPEYLSVVRNFVDAYSGVLMLVPAARRSLFGVSPWDRFLAARRKLDVLLNAEVAHRRARPEQAEDLLGMLLTSRYEDGSVPEDADLVDQLRTLIVAGHETTSTSIMWSLYYLHRTPDLPARARAEIREIGPDPEPADLAALPYLDAVCRETLRLRPPVPISLRRVRDDAAPDAVQVRGISLGPGETVGVSIPLLHTDPSVWTDPHRFDPDRWLTRKYTAFEYAPFGGGHRRCVGFALAEYEMRIVLGTILGTTELALRPRDLRRRPPLSVPRNIATSPARAISFDIVSVA